MSLSAKVLNQMLAREQWAQTRLAKHAGTTVVVVVGPAKVTYTIATDGLLVPGEAAPALTLTLSPLNVPALLARPARWNELVGAVGDERLAATLAEMALTLPWFVEREFARILGPIIGTRVADAGRTMLAFPGYAAERVGESVVRYLRDDAGLAANARDDGEFAAETSALAARLEALTMRIAALELQRQKNNETSLARG